MTSLTDRLLDSVPAGTYCFPALLRLLDVVETSSVPTAAVECVDPPRLLVNPEFVAQHAETPEKLAMLVLHELHHVILGHTRLYPRATPLENLAFDAVINAMLCRLLPDPGAIALMTDYYDAGSLPAALLRPVPGWLPEDSGDELGIAAPLDIPWATGADPSLVEAYRSLYWGDGCTYSELLDAISAAGLDETTAKEVQLLGDHDAEGDGASSGGGLERRSPALLEEVRRIVERWPQPPLPIEGRSWSSLLNERMHRPQPSPRAQLRRAIEAVARGGAQRQGRTMAPAMAPADTVFPHASRRGLVCRALGFEPLLHQAPLPVARRRESRELVHVYLDTSGSVEHMAGYLLRAVHDVRGLVFPLVHQFSTKVADVSLAELGRGVWRSTGGTDIDCVAAHMQKSRVRRALLVTDGYVGRPGAESQHYLRRVQLAVALTPGESSPRGLKRFTSRIFQLDI